MNALDSRISRDSTAIRGGVLIDLILQDESTALKFRQHAKKALCAENVDFCVEIECFKNEARKEIHCLCPETKKLLQRDS